MGWGELGCAALAGMLCRAPCHPLDTIKTVAFTSDVGGAQYGFRRGLKEILHREGVRGLYRGCGIATLGAAPGVGAYLTAYDAAKEQLGRWGLGSNAAVHLGSGFFAEAVSCVFWVPIDVVKERMQSQHPDIAGRYRSSWDGLATCLRNEGVRGLYRGYFSTLASFGPTSAIYFMAFEKFHRLCEPMGWSQFTTSLVAAGLGNATAALVTNPLELVKTRLQVQRAVLTVDGHPTTVTPFAYRYGSFIEGLQDVVRRGGVSGLQRGVVSRMIYAVPNAALTMALYSFLKDSIKPSAGPLV